MEAHHPFIRHLQSCGVSIFSLTPAADPQHYLALFLISSRDCPPASTTQGNGPQQKAAAAVCLWPHQLQRTAQQTHSLAQDLLACGHEVLLSPSGRVDVSLKSLQPEEVAELLHATAQMVTIKQSKLQQKDTAASSCGSPANIPLPLGPRPSPAHANDGTSIVAIQHRGAAAEADGHAVSFTGSGTAGNLITDHADRIEEPLCGRVDSNLLSDFDSSPKPGKSQDCSAQHLILDDRGLYSRSIIDACNCSSADSRGSCQMGCIPCSVKLMTAPKTITPSGQAPGDSSVEAEQQASSTWRKSLSGSSSNTNPRSRTMASSKQLWKAVQQLPYKTTQEHNLSPSDAQLQGQQRAEPLVSLPVLLVYPLRAPGYAQLEAKQVLAASNLADTAAATADAEDLHLTQNATGALQALVARYNKQRQWAQEFRQARRRVLPTRPKGWLANVRWFLHCKLRTGRFKRWAAHQHAVQAAREERQVAAAAYLASGGWHAVRSAMPAAH